MKIEDYKQYYIQGSDHYLIPKDDFIELVEENQELKKQVENMTDSYCSASKLKHERAIKIVAMNNQQKEFIKYLETKIEVVENKISNLPIISNERNYLVNVGNDLIEILQKYKEIIGVSDEKK